MIRVRWNSANTVLLHLNSLQPNLDDAPSVHHTTTLPLIMVVIASAAIKMQEFHQRFPSLFNQQFQVAKRGCAMRNRIPGHGDFKVKSEIIQVSWPHDTEPLEGSLTNTWYVDVDDVDAPSDGNVLLVFQIPIQRSQWIGFGELPHLNAL